MSSTPTNPNPSITHPAHGILSQAHAPDQATQIFTSKVKNKPLLLTPTPHGQTDKRALRRHIRAHKKRYHVQHQKPRPLSAKEKRTLRLHDLPDEEVKYEIYSGLNQLWRGYILEVMGFTRDGDVVADAVERRAVTQASHGSLIASADFHGMEVEVVRCKDVGRVGTKGIIVRETKGMVTVVTERDQVKRILKKGAVFRVVVEVPRGQETDYEIEGTENKANTSRKLVFELHGNQLEVRPVERAVRKFKWRHLDYL